MSTDGATGRTPSPEWIKISYSSKEGGACVEVATTGQFVLIRDSKDVSRPHLTVGLTGWTDFVRYAAGS